MRDVTRPRKSAGNSPDEARRLLALDIPTKGWEVVTVHMMGTARMGEDRATSVTDPFGLVHDADRLMVADASLFPTRPGSTRWRRSWCCPRAAPAT